jgi:FtsZ-interacting cell division protein YlmF
MSKEEWEDELAWDDDKPSTTTTTTTTTSSTAADTDDWESFDVDSLKDEEAEKKKQEEERKKKEEEAKRKQEEQRQKSEATKKLQKQGGAPATGNISSAQPKQLSGMMQAYQQQIADYDETLELFSGSQRPRIEILQPKVKKDFDEFATILTDKILEFQDSEHFIGFLKSLIEKSSEPLKSDDIKELQKTMTTLYTKKQIAEKEAKKILPQKAVKKTVKVDFSDDPFSDIAATGGGTNFDDDDDFM